MATPEKAIHGITSVPKKNSINHKLKSTLIGWSFIAIATIFICLFYFYPMLKALILSFQSGTGMNLEFVGFDNYVRLFKDPTFLTTVKNTVIYLIIQVPIMILLALFLSVLLNNKTLKYKAFFSHSNLFAMCHFFSRIFSYL